MRSLSQWIIALCASPVGVVVLAALDSTLFFSLPFGIDAAVILLSARMHATAWIVPVLATAGSVAGAFLTFWMGEKIGEKGLDRWVGERRLEKVHKKIENSGAVALAVLNFIPPPFPFTVFVLVAGALEVSRTMFFVTLAVVRIIRFGLEAMLAVYYGKSIIGWMDSDGFHDTVILFIVAAFVLTVVSGVKLFRSTRAPRRPNSGRRSRLKTSGRQPERHVPA